MASVDTGAIEGEIDRLRSLGLEELRREWRRLNHGEPPRISLDLLVLALGYRLQEIAHGGLGKATRRKLQTMAKALQTTGRVGPAPSLSLKPGARLVREWRGRTHTVTGYSTGGLAQAMRNGGPKLCKEISPNRTKVFHVKRFGTIDGLRERTFAKRGQIRNGDLAQAENRCRFKLWPERFFELFQNPRPHPEEQAKPAPRRMGRAAPSPFETALRVSSG
jgi:Protein of unknown function (DUF2924)